MKTFLSLFLLVAALASPGLAVEPQQEAIPEEKPELYEKPASKGEIEKKAPPAESKTWRRWDSTRVRRNRPDRDPIASPIATPKPQDSLQILDVTARDKHIWLVTAQGSILHSADKGKTWERQEPAWPASWDKPPALRQIHFLDTSRGFAAGSRGSLLATEDGGRTWTLRSVASASPSAAGELPDFRVLAFPDSLRGLLVERSGILHVSGDGGRTWELHPAGAAGIRTAAVGRGAGSEGWSYLAGMDGVVAMGRSWSDLAQDLSGRKAVPGEPELQAVHFLDTSTGLVGGALGLLARTRDGGNTWDTLRLPADGKVLALDFLDAKQGFAVGEKGLLFESRDAGGTWLRASRDPSEAGIGSYLRFPPPGYFLLLLLVLSMVWPVVRAPKVEVVQESIADQLVSDRPLEDDRFDVLGLCRKADALAAFLSNPRTEPPLTFGIMGEWGRGKSSLMNLLRNRLGRDGFTTVWFNAWHHQSEESLLASLLETIRRTRIAPWWTLDGMRFRANLTLRRILKGRETEWLMLLSSLVLFLILCRWNPLGIQWSTKALEGFLDSGGGQSWVERLFDGGAFLLTMFPLGVSLLTFWRLIKKALIVFNSNPARLLADLAGRSTPGDMSDKVGFREEFRREFSEVAEALRHAPLVVFIDDLDRCQPGKVMEILESINFLTTCGPCYFVVAMDKRQITRAIIVHDSSIIDLFKDKGEAHAQEYLEKIINIEVPVPEPEPEAYRRLMTLQDLPFKPSKRHSEARWQEALKNLPIYLVLGFLFYLSGSLLRAPTDSALTEVRRDSIVSAAETAVFPNAVNQTAPTGVLDGAGLEAALPFAWDAAGPPVFQSGNQAPWTRPFAVAIPALAGALLAWAAMAWIFQRRRRMFRDSQDFLKAVDEWHPLIFLGAKTPRAVKKFLNRLRFFAVLRRSTPLEEGAAPSMGDGELVALASVELGLRNMPDSQDICCENLRKFEAFLRAQHPDSPLADHVQALVNRQDVETLLKQFSSLGANVRVNA